jgi:hypothetical protein
MKNAIWIAVVLTASYFGYQSGHEQGYDAGHLDGISHALAYDDWLQGQSGQTWEQYKITHPWQMEKR